ncbi:MAG: DUF2203 domain-containing protein [bacterium]
MSRRLPRHFTLADALRMLPDVEQTIRRLRRIRDELAALRQTVEGQWAALEDDPATLTEIGEDQQRVERLEKEFGEAAGELERRGVLLRDLDMGLVDFPSLAGSAQIYLCWKVGEASIGFWHGLNEGYAARKPLSTLPGQRRH